jgi:phage baseplate assembly protein gpV
VLLSDLVMPDGQHAQALAQSELDRRSAAEVIFRGTVAGDPRLRPGARVSVTGVAEQFAGDYSLTEVTHTIDGRVGYVSEVSTAPPPVRPRGRYAVVTKGVVTRVSDPDRRGLVRVALPTYGGVETDWIGVLSAGAGTGKGLVVLPDVGDQVLVLFVNEDPAQCIVLGGLFGVKGPPDAGVDGESVRRYTLLTGKGQKVQLDDTAGTIRLENLGGSYVELSPDKVLIHAATDLDLEAPGRAVVIRGSSIDFQKG